jgi:phytoene synthase
LKKFKVTPEEIMGHLYSDRYRALAASVAARARELYQLARRTLPAEDRRAMVAAELMGSVYWQLLLKLEQHQFNVFGAERIRLSKPRKLFLVLHSWLSHLGGGGQSPYGTP